MKRTFKTLFLTLCLFGFVQIAHAQTVVELKESLKKAQEATLKAEQAREMAIVQAKEANISKLQAEKAREEAFKALEVANAEKAILEKKVAELTKKKKK